MADLGYPVISRKAVLACTMGQSGSLGSDSTKDLCSRMRGASREEGRSWPGTPEGPLDHRSKSLLCLPATARSVEGEGTRYSYASGVTKKFNVTLSVVYVARFQGQTDAVCTGASAPCPQSCYTGLPYHYSGTANLGSSKMLSIMSIWWVACFQVQEPREDTKCTVHQPWQIQLTIATAP